MNQTAYSRAFAAWFSRYETERKRQHRRKGARLAGFPEPPTSPEEIAAAVDRVGARFVVDLLEIHRSTLARWLAGKAVIPRPAWLVIRMVADGLLPGMSDDWREWRFDGDSLVHVGTRQRYTARELSGLIYQTAHLRALESRISALKKQNAHLLRVGDFKAANDPLIRTA